VSTLNRKVRKKKRRINRQQWSCETIERVYQVISDKEMRQRLAEFAELLLSSDSQLTREIAFSSDQISSQDSKPCFNHKQKG